jgi:hypothetical protein
MSPENYFGYDRTENFVSPGGARTDRRGVYVVPARLALNQWALAGEWTMEAGNCPQRSQWADRMPLSRARPSSRHGAAASRGSDSLPRVDRRQPPGPAHGLDVDDGGNGTVEQRLYQLIRQPGTIVDRRFEIEFLDAGVETFTFTFG